MTILYNCHHDGNQYRITKFNDGAVESTYLCTTTECECPAGARPTCRHRQMLPEMIARHMVNTHLFWDFDRRQSCDFEGNPARYSSAGEETSQETSGMETGPITENEWADHIDANLPPTAVQTVPLEITVKNSDKPMHLFGAGGIVTEYHKHAEAEQTVDPAPAGLHGEGKTPFEGVIIPPNTPEFLVPLIGREITIQLGKPWRRM